jgi:hypothetical protein
MELAVVAPAMQPAAPAIPPAVAAAAVPAEPAGGDAHSLWLQRNHARLLKKHAGAMTHVATLKFQTTRTRTGGSHDRGPMPSPLTQQRLDEQEWRTRWQRVVAGDPAEEEVNSLDVDEQPRRKTQQRRGRPALEEEHKQASNEQSDSSSGPSSQSSSRDSSPPSGFRSISGNGAKRARSSAAAAASEACAGSIPSIVIDPYCTLLSPSLRPHLIPDPSMIDQLTKDRILADACRRPAPAIWATDYARHTVRCILADGQIHTVAGGASSATLHQQPSIISKDATSGFADGTGTVSSLFAKPRGMALHPITGELFIADSANHCVRMVTSPAVVRAAMERAVREIEDASSFRALRDPTQDPAEEEARAAEETRRKQRRGASSSSAAANAGSSFPTPDLAASLRVVLSLFLPTITEYVGFDVRTIAGTPGSPGSTDTHLSSTGSIISPGQFRFPIGLVLRMKGQVGQGDTEEGRREMHGQERSNENEQNRPDSHEAKESSKYGLSLDPSAGHAAVSAHSHPSHPTSSYELYVSDAGNGCIRRVQPNPFANSSAASNRADRRASSTSPERAPRNCSPDVLGLVPPPDSPPQPVDTGFIVETIRAFVPIRCCHTSWMGEEASSHEVARAKQQGQASAAQQQEEKEAAASSSSSPPRSLSPPTSNFALALLESPVRLLSSASHGPKREYVKFAYPIGLGVRVEKVEGSSGGSRSKRSTSGEKDARGENGWREEQAAYGTIYTEEDPSYVPAAGEEALPRPRIHARSCSLILVDARAACVYSMSLGEAAAGSSTSPSSSLSPSSLGRISHLAGSASGAWGFTDGRGERARFCRPSGVAVDQRTGDIIVADAGNSCIRVIAARSNRVSTLVGHPHRVGCVDGPGFAATFFGPLAVALTPCPFYPNEHAQTVWVAGGFRQGLRNIVRCKCKWTYDTV